MVVVLLLQPGTPIPRTVWYSARRAIRAQHDLRACCHLLYIAVFSLSSHNPLNGDISLSGWDNNTLKHCNCTNCTNCTCNSPGNP
jgi:hypothetical protein